MEEKEAMESTPDNSSSRKPRKKVPRKKLVKKKKERGKYKSKSVGLCDVDVANCIFSDDEVGAAYMENQQSCSTQLNIPEDAEPQQEDFSDSSSTSTPGLTSQSPSESPSDVSRPSSAASSHQEISLIDSSCEVECSLDVLSDSLSSTSSSVPSRPGSRLSVSSMSAACDMQLMFGATDKEPDEKEFIVFNDIISAVVQTFKKILPSAWTPIATRDCLRLFLLSNSKQKAIQREIVLHYNGTVSIYVHCECLMDKKVLTLNSIPFLSDVESVSVFCENGLKIVKTVMNYDVCLGANHDSTRSVWHIIPETYIDINPYKEDSFIETCRSVSCHRLVKCEKGKAARCVSCSIVLKTLKKREASLRSETASPFTSNAYLTLQQALTL
ncbi:Siderophore peptide synthetase fer3 [Frankliniella fusca]|uniref:Siderophore peptide synthetase fer3 n=1 Tax=Frankliniella fusca TaxID=407009 RepID=A0AAE1HX58_9NEOP|nr:Siderophore peptide synthetase fer3 [Frankliniella fusca]